MCLGFPSKCQSASTESNSSGIFHSYLSGTVTPPGSKVTECPGRRRGADRTALAGVGGAHLEASAPDTRV